MKPANVKVSVVICAHTEQRWNDLLESVDSVTRQTVPPYEIIIAVDHNPSLYARAADCYPARPVVENSQERGLNGTRNSGVAVATGDIIAFMDDDAVAKPDWLEQLVAVYSSEDVVGVGGKITPIWLDGRPGWFPEEFDWVVGCTYLGMPEQVAVVRNLIGCNMSYRRSIITQVGGFRNDIGHIGNRPRGNDETEFCIRLRQKKPEVFLMYQPLAEVMHKVPASRANLRYFYWRCYLEGRSKAFTSLLVGVRDGLASERSYTLRVLPTGMWRGFTECFRGKNISGFARSMVIAAGLFITTLGYGLGRFLMLGRKIT